MSAGARCARRSSSTASSTRWRWRGWSMRSAHKNAGPAQLQAKRYQGFVGHCTVLSLLLEARAKSSDPALASPLNFAIGRVSREATRAYCIASSDARRRDEFSYVSEAAREAAASECRKEHVVPVAVLKAELLKSHELRHVIDVIKRG